jgi:hypothetical protein
MEAFESEAEWILRVGIRFVYSPICKLPASLKDESATMNEIIKHNQVIGQMNHKTADPKANASVFLFFFTTHFFKTILASRTNGTFGFARQTNHPLAKPKEPFFATAPTIFTYL